MEYPPQTETGLIEVKLLLAKELGLDLSSLEEEQSVAFGALPTAPRFKRLRTTNTGKLKPAASMFYSLARSLSAACPHPFVPLPEDPLDLRKEILESNGIVHLPGLLTSLWMHGVPVAHYSDWPDKLARPAGMAVDVAGRPVIILGSARKESAWHAFDVAHEAGHIAQGHVGRDQIIIDDSDNFASDKDEQEIQADEYALTVLGGSRDVQIPTGSSHSEIERSLKDLARQQKIDRGHLALRYGMETGRWPVAMTLLQQVEPSADAPVLVNQDFANENLDLEPLSDEQAIFLKRVLAL
tara:strand:+ start:321 stop:1211 length:891 start_codon:yes stop_codon:yes gene_type:complete